MGHVDAAMGQKVSDLFGLLTFEARTSKPLVELLAVFIWANTYHFVRLVPLGNQDMKLAPQWASEDRQEEAEFWLEGFNLSYESTAGSYSHFDHHPMS